MELTEMELAEMELSLIDGEMELAEMAGDGAG